MDILEDIFLFLGILIIVTITFTINLFIGFYLVGFLFIGISIFLSINKTKRGG